jgi:ABC-2 type transport system permease protein
MTAPATVPRARPPIVAIVGYTLRTCLPGKRWIGILLPCAAALLFGLLVHALDGTPTDEFAGVASIALFGLVLPVTCLVVGDAVLGAEVRTGSFAFTWLSPIPTWQIAVGRWAGGTIVASGCLAVSFALSAVVAGASGSAAGAAVAGGVGAMAYLAVFIAIGCIVRRAAVWSLAFVFLVERLLGAALTGIAQLSPSWEARAAFADFVGAPNDLLRDGIPQGTAALVRLVVITAIALALASTRLKHLRLSGSSD